MPVVNTAVGDRRAEHVFVNEGLFISTDLQRVSAMKIGTSTRAEIDAAVRSTIRHLSHLLTLQWDGKDETSALLDRAAQQLELSRRPHAGSQTFYAFNWLKVSATLGCRLAGLRKTGPAVPPGTCPLTVEPQWIKVGDYIETQAGLFRAVSNMATPRLGTKLLHFHAGRPITVSHPTTVHRPVERMIISDSYGPPPYAPTR
ncbi:hypothetical protein GCM10010305_41270 [Streptomyces termitum]|uniref:Uncharacterized protein n=2 Tax=Streptomyces termitum TaxID=67368 RepID=A0A918T938_9ACTN|nr:hypothetical protein GCM10010305_41270 [Streptomyces termitum]